MAKHRVFTIIKIVLLIGFIYVVIKYRKKDDPVLSRTKTSFEVHNMDEGFVKVEILAGQCEKDDYWKTSGNNECLNARDNGCITVVETSRCNATSIELQGDEISLFGEEEYKKYRFVTSVALNLQSLKFGMLVAKLLNQWKSHFCWIVKESNDSYYKEFHSEFDHIFRNNWRKLSAHEEDADIIRIDIREIVSQYFACLDWNSPDEYQSWRVRFLYKPEMHDQANLKPKKNFLDWKDNEFPRPSVELETEFHNGQFTFEMTIVNLAIEKIDYVVSG